MAKIPMGNFGQSMPQAERTQLPQSQSGQMIANSLQNVSQVAQQFDQKQREQEAQQKQIALYHDKLATDEAKIKLDDVLTTEMSDQIVSIKDQVSKGVISAAEGKTQLQTWSKTKYSEVESTLPMHSKHELDAYWNNNIQRQENDFLPLQLRADLQKSSQLVDRAFDIATRYDEQQGREYLETYLTNSNLPEADKSAYRQKYNTTRNLMSIDGRINTALENGSVEDLNGLLTDLKGGQYGYVDGPTIQDKQKQVLSRIDALNQKKQVEENKRVTMAGKVFNEFKANVLTGRAIDSEYASNVGTSVVGTEYEGEYQFYKAQSENFQKFSRLKTSDQLAMINQQKAKMKNSSSAEAQTEEKVLGVYEEIYKDKLNTIKDNPNQAVREAGLQPHDLTAAELKTDSGSFAKKVVENGVNQIALKDVNIKLQPISNEDLPEAKQAFEGMGVNAKLNFIGSLIGQSKNLPNGHRVWGATLGQLGGGDQSYILAGIARLNGYKSNEGEDVATAIISGTQALKNKQMIMPKDELLKQEFNKYVGNSASGQTANMTFAGFKSIYAHLVERDNYQHKDKDDISKTALSTALSLATGGVYEQDLKFGNEKWKVSKPYGMANDAFEANVTLGLKYISSKTNINVNDLESLRLRRSDQRSAKGEIQYDLVNARGNPLIVNGVVWRINMKGKTK